MAEENKENAVKDLPKEENKENVTYKIFQGDLPRRINAVKDKIVIAKVTFKDNIYLTTDIEVKKALEDYGYKVTKLKEGIKN